MTSIKIHKNTLKSILIKLKRKGIETLRVYWIHYNIEYIHEYMEREIDKILNDLDKYTLVNFVIDDDNGIMKVHIFNSALSYDIVDNRLIDLLRYMAIKKLC